MESDGHRSLWPTHVPGGQIGPVFLLDMFQPLLTSVLSLEASKGTEGDRGSWRNVGVCGLGSRIRLVVAPVCGIQPGVDGEVATRVGVALTEVG